MIVCCMIMVDMLYYLAVRFCLVALQARWSLSIRITPDQLALTQLTPRLSEKIQLSFGMFKPPYPPYDPQDKSR